MKKRKMKNRTSLIVFIFFLMVLAIMGTTYAYLKQDLDILGKANIAQTFVPDGEVCRNVSIDNVVEQYWTNGSTKYYPVYYTIKNDNSTPIYSWNIAVTLPENSNIESGENVDYKVIDNIVYLSGKEYNSYIEAGDSVTVRITISTNDKLSFNNSSVYNCSVEDNRNQDVNLNVNITKQSNWGSATGHITQFLIKVNNQSDKEIKTWQLKIKVPDGASVNNIWSANYVLKDNIVTITNLSYNGTIGSNGSQEFGIMIDAVSLNYNLEVISAIGS